MRTAVGADGDPEGEDWRLLAVLWTRGWITLSQLAAAWRTAAGDRITLRAVLLYERLITPEQVAEAERSNATVDPQLLRQVVREIAARPKAIAVLALQLLRQRACNGYLDLAASLLREGLTTEWHLLAAKAMLHSMHAVDLVEMEPVPAALQHVPGSVAREHHVLPIRIFWMKGKPVLVVAVGHPECVQALDAVRDAAGIKVQPVLAEAGALAAAIARHYPDG